MGADFFKSDQDKQEKDVPSNLNYAEDQDELGSDMAPVPSFGKRSAD